mmetsp:Transcript_38612/g.69200  ORF Transcript_38612/g.69200 Transcript_38612/m.69200 type:complete len:229 (+) Transcript_38612:340-1026(+)
MEQKGLLCLRVARAINGRWQPRHKHLGVRAPIAPDVLNQLLCDRCEVLLIGSEPFGGEFFQHVVDDEVYAALQQKVAALLLCHQVLEQRGPLPREVVARNLGKHQRNLDRNLVVVLADSLQQLATHMRLLRGCNPSTVPARPPLPDNSVLQMHAGQPSGAMVCTPSAQDFQEARAEAVAPLHSRQRLLRLPSSAAVGAQSGGEHLEQPRQVARAERRRSCGCSLLLGP